VRTGGRETEKSRNVGLGKNQAEKVALTVKGSSPKEEKERRAGAVWPRGFQIDARGPPGNHKKGKNTHRRDTTRMSVFKASFFWGQGKVSAAREGKVWGEFAKGKEGVATKVAPCVGVFKNKRKSREWRERG